MKALYSICILVGALTLASCTYRPSVVIKHGTPQQFFISAKGILDVFSVRGPVCRCEAGGEKEGPTPMETYWEIAPLADFDVSQLRKSGPIVYGTVPAGFRQVTPANGVPQAICEGGPYAVQLAIRDGGGVNMLFGIHDGKIVTEADAD